jgi:hypothetical protein
MTVLPQDLVNRRIRTLSLWFGNRDSSGLRLKSAHRIHDVTLGYVDLAFKERPGAPRTNPDDGAPKPRQPYARLL